MKSDRVQTEIKTITEASFGKDVLQSDVPVLVMFWTAWSSSCQILEAVLKEIAGTWAGKSTVVKVNADDSPDLSFLFDVQSVPTLIYFVKGQACVRIVGTATKEAILAKVKPFEPAKIKNGTPPGE